MIIRKNLLKNCNLGIIGVGNMGQVLLKGVLKAGLFTRHRIVAADADARKLRAVKKDLTVLTDDNNVRVVRDADIVLLCVKPQNMDEILAGLAAVVRRNQLFISIAAGVRTKKVEAALGKVPVVRVMPNTPALIGEGMSALCPGKYAHRADLARAAAIFNVIGKTIVVKERMMDAVTGLSGSGPAYVFTMIEGLIEAGVKAGLTEKQAEILTVQTLIGAAKLVEQARETPAQLRDRVASPGGTTLAGLKAMNINRFKGILHKTVLAATKRSKELGR